MTVAELPLLDGSVNCCSLSEKQLVIYTRGLKTFIPFGPVILLLGILFKGSIWKCVQQTLPGDVVQLFVVAKDRKQLKLLTV